MATRLTDEYVKKIAPPKSGQIIVFDDLVAGFGLRVTPNVKSFIAQWRTSDGKKPRETLGGSRRYPHISVAEARDLARQRLGEALGVGSHGGDAPLRLAMRAWFTRQVALGVWRPRYVQKVTAIIRLYIEGEASVMCRLSPAANAAIFKLGAKAVTQVSRDDVMAVVRAIKGGAGAEVMAIVSSFYGSMRDEGIAVLNPASNRLKVTGGRRVRHRTPSEKELLLLWRGFEKEGDPDSAAFQMLVLTGARRREVTSMRWDEIDLKKATWTLPAERRKTGKKDPKPFTIALHPLALAILKRQPVIQDNPFVFWGRRDKRAFDFHHAILDRLHETVQVDNWRLHDIRRVVRSGMARLGVPQAVAEQCLGHKIGGLAGVYDTHSYAKEMRAAWKQWGDRVQKLTGAKS